MALGKLKFNNNGVDEIWDMDLEIYFPLLEAFGSATINVIERGACFHLSTSSSTTNCEMLCDEFRPVLPTSFRSTE